MRKEKKAISILAAVVISCSSFMNVQAEEAGRIITDDGYGIQTVDGMEGGSSYINPLQEMQGLINISTDNGAPNLSVDNTGLKLIGNVGNHLILDENSPAEQDGVASVEITENNNALCGILFRAVDEMNMMWVGFTQENTLILREVLNGEMKNIFIPNKFGGNYTGLLKVKYVQDQIQVFVGEEKVYDGLRPYKAEDGDNAQSPCTGRIGVMGWSSVNSRFCNLSYEPVSSQRDERYLDFIHDIYLGLTQADYTDESWALYEDAVNAATTIFESSGSTAQDREAQYQEVVKLRNALRPKGETRDEYKNEFSGSEGRLQYYRGAERPFNWMNEKIEHKTRGEVLAFDMDSPLRVNGKASADFSFDSLSTSRTALVFRAADNDNFSFVGIEPGQIRIRDMVKGQLKDIEVKADLPNSFTLSVEYCDTNLTIYANSKMLYQGGTPISEAQKASGALISAPQWGRVGLYCWDIHSVSADNLVSGIVVPSVVDVSAEHQAIPCSIQPGQKKITLYIDEKADFNAITPRFTVRPSETTITPEGPQDFSAGPIEYTMTLGEKSWIWTVEAQESKNIFQTIESETMAVRVNPVYPQVYDYQLKEDGGKTIGGSYHAGSDTITINDAEYNPQVNFETPDASSAKYSILVPDVDLDGNGSAKPRDVEIEYLFKAEGNTLTKKITKISGDEEGLPFRIQFAGASLFVDDSQEGAQIAVNGDTENTIFPLASAPIKEFTNRSYVIAANSKVSASMYTTYQYSTPFRARVSEIGGKKTAQLFENAYVHRLADGKIPTMENADGSKSDIGYECKIYVCGDANENGTVDWQDSALWIRTQIPQVPKDLREFFNGGNWMQTHGAFAGNSVYNRPDTYKASSSLFVTPQRLVEIQREIENMTDGVGRNAYCYVGWNGRGHDYGWPNINEVPLNPVIGTEEEYRQAQKDMDKVGGTLGFHLNMTDMTDNSASYLRGPQTDSPFGNRSSSTGAHQYTGFGWSAQCMNHYTDYPYALNRQDAFVERFNAPFILYQDVMLPYTMGKFGITEEHYAERTEIQHWKTLGTYAATEYYYPEKRTGGQFMLKNYAKPNTVDEFIVAGQTMIHNTRNYNTLPTDYIWANLYSDNARSGNIMVSFVMDAANYQTELTFLLSYPNAYAQKQGLKEYVGGETPYTLWGNGVKYEANNSTGDIILSQNGTILSKVNVKDGRVKGNVCIPSVDDTQRIFIYSSEGGNKTFDLPDTIGADQFKLYRLSNEGRVFCDNVTANGGRIEIETEGSTGYVLDYSDSAAEEFANENYNLNTNITGSSRNKILNMDVVDKNDVPVDSIDIYVSKELAPKDDWNKVLHDLTPKMFDKDGNLRYHTWASAQMASDNRSDTFWQPTSEDLSDGEAKITYEYRGVRKVQEMKLEFGANDIYHAKITGKDVQGAECVLYEGELQGKQEIQLDEEISLRGLTLTLSGLEGTSIVQLKEFAVYGKEIEDTAVSYKVVFIGKDDVLLKTQVVERGKDAEAPEAPEIEGFTFKGWDKDFRNVQEELVVKAIYEEIQDSSALVQAEKVNLKKLIKAVQDKKEKDYTKDSWKVFAESLEAAKVVLDKDDVTADAVIEARVALEKAAEELKRVETSTDEGDKPSGGEKPDDGDKPSGGDKPDDGNRPGSSDRPDEDNKPSRGDKVNLEDKPNSGAPVTGDYTPIGVVVLICLLSFGCCVVFVRRKKR